MDSRIIYPLEHGGLAIIIPAPDYLKQYSIIDIADKDIPKDTPYKIIDVSEVPTDRTFRAAWEADFSNPDGYSIGAEAWFAEQEEKKKQQSLEVMNDLNQPE